MPRPPVTSKQDFYRRLRNDEFGVNHNFRWYSVREWEMADWLLGHVKIQEVKGSYGSFDLYHRTRLWGIQSIGPPGARCDYNVPTTEVAERCRDWPYPYTISPMMPDDQLVVQGEIWDNYIFTSRALLPMRQALREAGEHRELTAAKVYLQHLLPSEDIEDILYLQTEYPGHVIEFSTYAVPVGVKKRRTVFWEVRGGNPNYGVQRGY